MQCVVSDGDNMADVQITIEAEPGFNVDLFAGRLRTWIESELKGYWDFEIEIKSD